MPAPTVICQLVQQFSDHGEAYHSGKYNEAQLRLEFLDPFFEALGWDMFNKQGYAEAYKDVIHEDAIRIGGVVKAPDYAFRVGGTRKFFVEAKTPAVDVKEEISPAYQLRRYAWSAKLPLSILTDFEEFAVYDCRTKPAIDDKASTGRVMYLRYPDYLEKWEEIATIFSHEAVLKGSFDKYAETALGKHGTAEVDQAFLAEISRWRELLARNIALRNTGLSQRELNFAVQMTIDRIIFLRICEDRGIEFYGQLQSLLNGREVYSRLVNIFRKADQRYNSGLFHFRKEKDQVESPDELTPGLVMDDRSLKEILGNLYYPDSPYEFSVLPADILGQVYEQFLGKVIRLTAGHHAVIEEKPEVKKAGGVYYTPTYIVEYIVRHTVGGMLEDRKPGEKGVGKSEPLRILDPACGSGSFLLGAFQYLLNWYRDGYFADGVDKWTKGKSPTLYQAAHGEWKLTTGERKRILLDHIYGVDIDPQAVEVTKLSLLLKVLEGESEQILAHQLSLWQERALPDLGKNIKCGNSLIGPDFYQGKQMGFMDEEERYRINAFDWEREFPQVFGVSDGGFDVVIGNPPYIRIQALKEWAPKEVEFYKKRYTAASKGNYDIYVVFVEKGLSVLNKRGRLGFILPHKFFNAQYGKPIRELLAKGKHLSKIVHFGDQQVFSGATTYTCLMFLGKTGSETLEFEKVNNLEIWRGIRLIGSPETLKVSQTGIISAGSITAREWNFIVGQEAALFEKLRQMPVKLGDVTDRIYQGLITGADAVFILRKVGSGSYYSQATGKEHCIEDDLMHDLCKGSVNIHRYSITELEKSILFPYRVEAGRANLLSKEELVLKYHFAWEYLQENRKILETRERGKWRHSRWYAFGRTQNLGEMEQIKILTPSIAKRASYTLDKNGNLFFIGSGGGGGGGYGITIKYTKLSYEYILGLLNSYLLDSYLKTYSSPFSGGYFAYNRQYIEQLPIHLINFSDPVEIAKRNRIVVLVESMLTFNHQIASAKTPSERNFLQRQIEATDREIDALVYELYGLTDEEIRIVEGRE